MTTWYVSLEDGTNSNSGAGAGDSFATRRQNLTNLTAASLVAGDSIRIMATPPPTLTAVNASWTNGPVNTTLVPVSSTNATPIVVTMSAGHGLVTGDTVAITGHTTNTKANGIWNITVSSNAVTLLNAAGGNSVGNGTGGASGTVRRITSNVVTLASAITKNIACNGNRGIKTNWTASSNVTCTVNTTNFKEGGESQQIAVASGFTTGKAAYFATGTLDLSGYQQISFWIRQSSGTLGAAGSVQIKLCSDTLGATAVNTFNIPLIGILNSWQSITIDLATNLGNAIASIAFYVVTDNGAQTFIIDNIIACKAASDVASLNLNSLIGKNKNDLSYWPIQSINELRIMLDGPTSTEPLGTALSGYFGTTESTPLYKRECFKTIPAAAIGTAVQTINDTGSAGSLITISGGWDRTDMSTQVDDTWLNGQNNNGNAINIAAQNYLNISRINFTRYGAPIGVTAGNRFCTISIPQSIGNTLGYSHAASLVKLLLGAAINNGIGVLSTASLTNSIIGDLYGNATAQLQFIGVDKNTAVINGNVFGSNQGIGFDFNTGNFNSIFHALLNNNYATASGNTLGGSLKGTVYDSVTTNLTLNDIGGLDWAKFGPSVPTFKSGGLGVCNYTQYQGRNDLFYWTNDAVRLISWTGGDLLTTGTDNTEYDRLETAGGGFVFTLPADTTSRTFTITTLTKAGVGGNAGGKLIAHLSDNSCADYVHITPISAGQVQYNYTIVYQAASASQTLTVTWLLTTGTQTSVGVPAVGLSLTPLSLPPNSFPGIPVRYHANNVNFGTGRMNKLYDIDSQSPVTAHINQTGVLDEWNYLIRAALGSGTKFVSAASNLTPGIIFCQGSSVYSTYIQQVECSNYRMYPNASVRHTASDVSLEVLPINATNIIAENPIVIPIASVAVSADTQVTFTIWVRRTNTGLSASLVVKGFQGLGMYQDYKTAMTAAADTWEQLTVLLTIPEVGVVDVVMEVYGGTTYSLYIDDFAVSQA